MYKIRNKCESIVFKMTKTTTTAQQKSALMQMMRRKHAQKACECVHTIDSLNLWTGRINWQRRMHTKYSLCMLFLLLVICFALRVLSAFYSIANISCERLLLLLFLLCSSTTSILSALRPLASRLFRFPFAIVDAATLYMS